MSQVGGHLVGSGAFAHPRGGQNDLGPCRREDPELGQDLDAGRQNRGERSGAEQGAQESPGEYSQFGRALESRGGAGGPG